MSKRSSVLFCVAAFFACYAAFASTTLIAQHREEPAPLVALPSGVLDSAELVAESLIGESSRDNIDSSKPEDKVPSTTRICFDGSSVEVGRHTIPLSILEAMAGGTMRVAGLLQKGFTQYQTPPCDPTIHPFDCGDESCQGYNLYYWRAEMPSQVYPPPTCLKKWCFFRRVSDTEQCTYCMPWEYGVCGQFP